MSTLRAFIAVELPEDVRHALAAIGRTLAERLPRGAVKWVRPEQIHLTLRFLGDTPTAQLPDLQAALDATTRSRPAFSLTLGELGSFPGWRQPRVIWVGLEGDEAQRDRLLRLTRDLDARLAALGRPPEDKPFRAHLTLGRVKDDAAARAVDWKVSVPRLAVPVNAVHLIESRLFADGPVYTIRYTSRLAGSPTAAA